jgi:hypothetical protein
MHMNKRGLDGNLEIGKKTDRQPPTKKPRFHPTALETPATPTLAHKLALGQPDWRTPEADTSARHAQEQRQDAKTEREKLQFQYNNFSPKFIPRMKEFVDSSSHENDQIAGRSKIVEEFKDKIRNSVNILYIKKRENKNLETDTEFKALQFLRDTAKKYKGSLSVAEVITKKFDELDQDWNKSMEKEWSAFLLKKFRENKTYEDIMHDFYKAMTFAKKQYKDDEHIQNIFNYTSILNKYVNTNMKYKLSDNAPEEAMNGLLAEIPYIKENDYLMRLYMLGKKPTEGFFKCN